MSQYPITPGGGGLPRMILAAPDGAQAEVYLHGGHLTSWIPVSGGERLFLSPSAVFSSETAIRGGVPVLFPQFSVFGPLRKHGFARTQSWEAHGVEERSGLITAIFTLADNETTRSEWPFSFQIELAVTLGGNRLNMTLSVTNMGSEAFRFTTGLHTYLRVQDLAQVRVDGLKDGVYRDHTDGDQEKLQTEKFLMIEGEVDRMYYNPRPVLTLQDREDQLQIGKRGFTDTVIWNPGAVSSASLADLEPEGYRSFLCIEAASIGRPVRLSPDESWQGTQTLTTVEPPKHG